jgi:hypothetical protein
MGRPINTLTRIGSALITIIAFSGLSLFMNIAGYRPIVDPYWNPFLFAVLVSALSLLWLGDKYSHICPMTMIVWLDDPITLGRHRRYSEPPICINQY